MDTSADGGAVPSEEERRVYRAVWNLHEGRIAAMRPGATIVETVAATRDRAGEHGPAEQFLNLFIGRGLDAVPTSRAHRRRDPWRRGR